MERYREEGPRALQGRDAMGRGTTTSEDREVDVRELTLYYPHLFLIGRRRYYYPHLTDLRPKYRGAG